jgi:hypothetical protein
MSNEPSKHAIEAAKGIESPGGVGVHNVKAQKRYSEIIQSAIDAACAERDAQISDLHYRLNLAILSGQAKDQRIAQMSALLDAVPHVIFYVTGHWGKHSPDMQYAYCPACAWAAKKKEWKL